MHPGITAKIYLDRKEIGIIGRVHPLVNKDDIYVESYDNSSRQIPGKDKNINHKK